MSGLASSDRRPIDAVLGAQFQSRGFSAGAGLTWAVRHIDRGTVGQVAMSTDRLGFLVRLSYHPGVRVYTPPPPPPPPPPPVAPAPPANRPPVVAVSCDPCEVEFGDEVRLRADASDPDGDPLVFRWNAPAGTFIDATDRATTRWQAPAQEARSRSPRRLRTAEAAPPPTRPPCSSMPRLRRRRASSCSRDIHFDFDRYSLRPGATRVLDEVVAALAEDPDLGIQIEGHTCNIGTNEYNLALGDRRATSVREYLTDRGVTATRLQMISYGEERPAHDNAREGDAPPEPPRGPRGADAVAVRLNTTWRSTHRSGPAGRNARRRRSRGAGRTRDSGSSPAFPP